MVLSKVLSRHCTRYGLDYALEEILLEEILASPLCRECATQVSSSMVFQNPVRKIKA